MQTLRRRFSTTALICLLVITAGCFKCERKEPPKRDAAMVKLFRATHPCPATGKTKGACPGYVVDHITALKNGGGDHPYNMQWQTVEDGKLKDRWE